MYRRNMDTETNIRTGAEWEVSKCLVEWKDVGLSGYRGEDH